MKRRLLYFLFCALPILVSAQSIVQKDLGLPYQVRQAATAHGQMPLLILMHGYGSNEQDLFGLEPQLPKEMIIVSVRAPMSIGNNGFQWFGMEGREDNLQGKRKDIAMSAAKIKALIPQLVRKYNADPKRVFLSGFSQGAMMCYEVGLTAPGLLKGIAPLGGKLFDGLKPSVKANAELKHLRVFIGHGMEDKRVNYHHAQQALTFLNGIGLKPELHLYPGLTHSISSEEIKALSQWLLQP